MAYRKIFLTINAETGKQVDPASMEVVRKAERPQMYLDEYIVLCMTFLNSDGTAHEGFGASDTWSMGTDDDFTHYSLTTGTLTGDESGAQTAIAVTYTADPTATLEDTGFIWPINSADNTERIEYSAVAVTGSGPYTATFTVSLTLDNAYLTGDVCKVEESLLAWASDADFNTGEWASEDVTGGLISCRFPLTATALTTAIGTAALLEDALCEITRFEVGTAYPSKPGQFKVTLRNIVVDSEAQPVLQPTDFSQLDARYHQVVDAKYAPATELTIASGSITRTQMMHKVDTQADAGTDDLDTIAGAAEGDIIRLYLANAARIVTITNAGNIDTSSGNSVVMDGDAYYDLYYDGSAWMLNDILIAGTTINLPDNTTFIVDDGDATKKIAFQASGIATSTTRTFTMPNWNLDFSKVKVGGANAPIEVVDATGPQQRLTHTDGVDYSDSTVDADGELTIAPSGAKTNITGELLVSDDVTLAAAATITAATSLDLDSPLVSIGGVTPTARLHLPAGTAAAGTAPLKVASGTLLTTSEAGAIEYDGCKFYLTNVATARSIDRTSDVAVATVTVENTDTETTIWTGAMAANSLCAGNMFKFHCDGVVQNAGASADDEVTLRIKVGGNLVATLNPTTKAIGAGSHWHIDANATQRTIGASGSRAVHIDLVIDDDSETLVAVAAINTTANMDVTVTAQWATADASNIISLYQGYMEYKN